MGWSGAGARPGSLWYTDDVNQALNGVYDGEHTDSQLNYGNQEYHWAVPLSFYHEAQPGHNPLQLKWTHHIFSEEGLSKRRNGFANGLKVKKYYPIIPYITINQLDNKVHQWLGLNNSAPNEDGTRDVNYGSITNPDRPGPQLEITNSQGLPEIPDVKLKRDLKLGMFKIIGAQSRETTADGTDSFESDENSSISLQGSVTFRFDGGKQNYTIKHTQQDEARTTLEQGTQNTENTENTEIGFSAGYTPPAELGGLTTELKLTQGFKHSWGASKTWSYDRSTEKKQIYGTEVSLAIDTSGWKSGQKISAQSGLTPSNVDLNKSNKDSRIHIGERYTALFSFNVNQGNAPISGYSVFSGKPNSITPETLFWQVNGDDLPNNFKDDIKKSIQLGDGPMNQFKPRGGESLFGIKDQQNIEDGKTLEGFILEDDGTFKILNKGSAGLKQQVDITYELKHYIEGPNLNENNPNQLRNRISDRVSKTSTTDKIIWDRSRIHGFYSLNKHGGKSIGDHYEGHRGSDRVVGSHEGEDLLVTKAGRDIVYNLRNSIIHTGNGSDQINLGRSFNQNTIHTGKGADNLRIKSTGNVIYLEEGADNVKVNGRNNTIWLGQDNAQDSIHLSAGSFAKDDLTTIAQFDIGKDRITGLKELVKSVDYLNEYNLISFKIKGGGSLDLWLNSETRFGYNLDDNRHLFLLVNQSNREEAKFLNQTLNRDIYCQPVVSDNLVKDVLLFGGIIDKSSGVKHISHLERKLDQSSRSRNHESKFIKDQANKLTSNSIATEEEAIDVTSKALNAATSLKSIASHHSSSELYSHFLMTHLNDLHGFTDY